MLQILALGCFLPCTLTPHERAEMARFALRVNYYAVVAVVNDRGLTDFPPPPVGIPHFHKNPIDKMNVRQICTGLYVVYPLSPTDENSDLRILQYYLEGFSVRIRD